MASSGLAGVTDMLLVGSGSECKRGNRKVVGDPSRGVEVAQDGTSISCIVPTLGRGEVLCKTIDMLLDQTWPAHEIIIVDQTPKHNAEAERRLATWERRGIIRRLRQSDLNASKARNAGALAATGKAVLFLDDDIRIERDFLESYAEAFAGVAVSGVCGPVIEGEGNVADEVEPRALTSDLGWLLHFPKNYGKDCESSLMMSGNAAVRRDLFISLGGMDENYEKGAHREESDFAMRFRRAGYRFQYRSKCRVIHLGARGVRGGGARTWQGGREFWYFHHCVGDWYFNLGFGNIRTIVPLLVWSLRHFVFNRRSLNNPWRIPFALVYWLAGLPSAAMKRLSGAQLLKTGQNDGSQMKHR